MRHIPVLHCLLMLLLSLSSSLLAESPPTILQTTEGHLLGIQTSTVTQGFKLDSDAYTVEVEVPPSPGHLTSTVTGWTYEAKLGFVGFDRIVFRVTLQETDKSLLQEVVVRVLPEALPIAGTFYPTGHTAFGRYLQNRAAFQLCDPWEVVDGQLKCDIFPVQGASPGWLPVYGDWDGDGWHAPSLFDPATGTLFQLAFKSARYEIVDSTRLKGMQWTWPVAGDWNGDGVHQLVLVTSDGRPYLFRELSSDVEGQAWPDSLPVPTDGRFPWPTLRLSEDAVDGLAIIDGRTLRWIYWPYPTSYLQASRPPGETALDDEHVSTIPIHGRAVALLNVTHLYTLARAEKDGIGRQIKAVTLFGKPSTLPLTFPHEPPGG